MMRLFRATTDTAVRLTASATASADALRRRARDLAAGDHPQGLNRGQTHSRWLPFGALLSAAIAIVLVGLPIALARAFSNEISPAAISIAIMVILAFTTYAFGALSSLAALLAGFVLLNGWSTDQFGSLRLPAETDARAVSLIFLVSGGVVIWLVRRIGLEGTTDRQETLAARSAATALSAIETVAATQHDLTPEAEIQLHDAIVRAVVSVNRVHGGALLLANEDPGGFELRSSYGLGQDGGQTLLFTGAAEKLVNAVARERRVIQAHIPGEQRHLRLSEVRTSRMRSLMAAPVITEDDVVAGVLVIGLLVEHRFSGSEIRRLSALASQVAAILETMTVTGEREARLRQAQSEQHQLERVIAAVPEALVICAPPDGRVIAINEAARDLFRGDEHALSLDSVRPVGPDASAMDFPLVATLASLQPVGDVECVVEHDDGSVTPVLASAAPIHDQTGEMIAVVTSFRDITSLKEASRIRDEFVSVVSHELRSPLTPIRGFVQLVARELEREEGHDLQVERLNSIAGHVDRLTRLVDDLLDVSSLRSGTLEIRAQETDLVTICREVAALRTADETVGQQIVVTAESETILGNWDHDRIQQVIDNLVGNALKYSPADSTVEIVVAETDGYALATIHDEGAGISPDLHDEVFGAFFRTPEATAGQVPGLGLGLYICQALAQAHGGTLEIRDRTPLPGTAFTLRLPTGRSASDAEKAISPTVIESTRSESQTTAALD